MYFIIITKAYQSGEDDIITFGRSTERTALKLYNQEVTNAQKVADYIKADITVEFCIGSLKAPEMLAAVEVLYKREAAEYFTP